MNTSTGELIKIEGMQGGYAKLAVIRDGFVQLTESEAKIADKTLAGRSSVILPPDHPLRERVTKRVGKPATKGQIDAIVKIARRMGIEAFIAFMKDNTPDITIDVDTMTCGQAQRLLTLLQKMTRAEAETAMEKGEGQ